MKIVIDDRDRRYAQMTSFRIHHMISDKRMEQVGEADIIHLWLQWRIDHDLPLKDEEWELYADCWEIWIESTCIQHEGKYIGELSLVGPPSPELKKLLEKKKAA